VQNIENVIVTGTRRDQKPKALQNKQEETKGRGSGNQRDILEVCDADTKEQAELNESMHWTA